jgi:uncharacterized protein (DUF2236 family)
MTPRPSPGASISRRVNAERIVLLGWGRAILLQLAHPLLAAGVYDHSGFRTTPLAAAARLRDTVRAMLSLTFGSESAVARTIGHIGAIHRRVNGELREPVGRYPAGSRYSAEDPALVLWVHVTLIESVLLAYERFVGPLSAEEKDAYCAEALPVAVALLARSDEVPRTFAELRARLDCSYAGGLLAVGAQAREVAAAVLSPRGTWAAAPATGVNRLVTIGTLPSSIREMYGFGWTPRDERRLARVVSVLRSVRRALPDRLALWPDARTPLSAPPERQPAGSDPQPSP